MTTRHRSCFGIWFLCVAALVAATPARAADWRVDTVVSTHKLTATAPGVLEPFPAAPVTLLAARGEWESFQIVLTAGAAPLRDITVKYIPAESCLAAENVRLYRENYVYIDHPSGNQRLEKLWWPDALIPLSMAPIPALEPHRAVAVWVAVFVPPATAPGTYPLDFEVVADGAAQRVPAMLQVFPATMPPASLHANVAVYYDVVRDWYAKNAAALSDADFATLKKNYYDFLLDYRLNAYDPPVAWTDPAIDGYLRDPRVRGMRVTSVDSANLPDIIQTFKRNNALDKAYYYWIDEPPPERFPEVKTTTAKLRQLDPLLKHCVTVFPNQELQGAVDIWCPNLGDYFGLGHFDAAELRRAGGRRWWYTMVEPKFPYPTWLVDDAGSAVRLYGAMMAHYGIEGFVYSMVHGWGPKPFENIQSFAGTNGDGTLIYPAAVISPGNLNPLPSVRLMLLRDAVEDYELLIHRGDAPDRLTRALLPAPTPLLHPAYASIDWPSWKRLLLEAQTTSVDVPTNANRWLWTRAANQLLEVGERRGVISAARTAPTIDGVLTDLAWSDATRLPEPFVRFAGDTSAHPPTTQAWLAHRGDQLVAAFACSLPDGERRGDWVALDLAPRDGHVRWRFIVTASGRAVVEKHTREGHFGIEGLAWRQAWKADTKGYRVELQIPLAHLELGALDTQWRVNLLRRVKDTRLDVRYIVRAHPDAGDVLLMPLAVLKIEAAYHATSWPVVPCSVRPRALRKSLQLTTTRSPARSLPAGMVSSTMRTAS